MEKEIPLYKCHKEVRAIKIAAIEFEQDGSAKIAGIGYGLLIAKSDYRSKFKGHEGDLGYYVVYEDGYQSWSPTKAFEEGYTKVES